MTEAFIRDNIQYIAFAPLIFWALLSLWWLISVREKNLNVIESIPPGFTTAGVLGTFIGISYGLYFFDVNDISGSIPELLAGLKQAFYTSIAGIAVSMVVSKYIEFGVLKAAAGYDSPEVEELKNITGLLLRSMENNDKNLEQLINRVDTGLRQAGQEQIKILNEIHTGQEELKKVMESIHADQESGVGKLESAVQHISEEIKHFWEGNNGAIAKLETTIKDQFSKAEASGKQRTVRLVKTLQDTNRELSKQLAEMNSKELLRAMEQSVEIFNNKMEDILQRLIKKNFEALNNSVQQLNSWQIQNKENVDQLNEELKTLIDKNKELIGQFEVTSQSVATHLGKAAAELESTSSYTKQLTDDNGRLNKIIKELESIALGDNQFKRIIDKAEEAIQSIAGSAEQFKEGMEKVEDLQNNLFRVQESLVTLTNELQELAKLKDTNGAYWKDVLAKMEEGIGLLNNGSRRLSTDLDEIDGQFKKNLHETFLNLDKLIRSYIKN